jgi:hypothetical protein
MNMRVLSCCAGWRAREQGGFTLLGVVFAVSFALILMIALAGLTVSVFKVSRASEERLIATALAREGLELVRSIRDDNWFSDAYVPESPELWRGDSNEATGNDSLCNGDRIIDSRDPRLRVGTGELYLNPSTNPNNNASEYAHANAGGALTIYNRMIKITPEPDDNCGQMNGGGNPDPILVTSTVRWQEKPTDPPKSVSLSERLYNWKKP